MRKILLVTTLFLGVLSSQAQEKVMTVQKKDGTSARTRVADLTQISFLTVDGIDEVMLEKLANNAVLRTKVNEVEEILFADTAYNLNSSGNRLPFGRASRVAQLVKNPPAMLETWV